MEDGDSRLTTRLRLEPVGPANARDLWLVHNDDEVSGWYDNSKPTLEEAERRAAFMGDSWRFHGVHKWIAYDRVSGEVVGRCGLSRTPIDDDWGQIYAFLPAEPWVRVALENHQPFVAHANWLEIGWALRREFWGHGYASEIGRAALAFAFDVLGVQAVVSCTVCHNVRNGLDSDAGHARFCSTGLTDAAQKANRLVPEGESSGVGEIAQNSVDRDQSEPELAGESGLAVREVDVTIGARPLVKTVKDSGLLQATNDLLVYERRWGISMATIALNFSNRPQDIDLPKRSRLVISTLRADGVASHAPDRLGPNDGVIVVRD